MVIQYGITIARPLAALAREKRNIRHNQGDTVGKCDITISQSLMASVGGGVKHSSKSKGVIANIGTKFGTAVAQTPNAFIGGGVKH